MKYKFNCKDKNHNDVGDCGHRALAAQIVLGLWPSLHGDRYYEREDQITEILTDLRGE